MTSIATAKRLFCSEARSNDVHARHGLSAGAIVKQNRLLRERKKRAHLTVPDRGVL